MRKYLFTLFSMAAMLLLPLVASAQTATTLTDAELPRTFTFEEGNDDSAFWSFANGSDAWYIGGATYASGSRSLYISNDNGVSNAYSSNNVYSYAWVTVDIQQSGEYEISFDWKCYGEGSSTPYDYMRVYWASATVTPTAGSAINNVTQIGGTFNQRNSWQNFYTTQVITDADLGTYNLIFMWRSDVSGIYSAPAAIDNLYFGRLTCPAPTALTFSNLTNNGATATWTPVGEESSWVVMVNGEEVYDSPVSTPTYTFSGLDANTDQNVVIRAVCGDGDTSMAVNGTFHTLCQNGNCQLVVAPSSTYSYSSYYNPSVAVYQNGSAISTGSDTRTVDICNGDSVIILVAQMPSSTYYTPSVRVTDVAGTDLFNASIAGRSVGDTLLAIDNGCPSCLPISNLTLNTFDANSATISWTAGNDETEWAVFVNGEEAIGSPATTTSFTVGSLESNTSYTIAVRSVCGNDDTAAARSVSFRTECEGYAELPFSTSFEELDPTSDHHTDVMPECWLPLQMGSNPGANGVFPSAYRWQPNAHTGSVYFEFESSSGETEVLALPRMQDISNLQLSFYASVVNNSNFRLETGVIESDDDGNDIFVPVDTIQLTTASSFSSSSYYVYNILFNTYEGNGDRIALRTTSTGSGTYTLFIDDFSVIYAGVPVLGPFNPATHTVSVDTNLVLEANLMAGDGVTYAWTSAMADAGDASFVGSTTDSAVTIHYTAGGIDSVAVIASTSFGDDTAFVKVFVIDDAPVSSFPYVNGFEDGDDLSWRTANAANGWYIGTATAYAGSRSLYVSDVNGTTNTYGSITGSAYAYRTIHFSQAGEYGVSFMWHNNGNSSNFFQTYLTPGDIAPATNSSYYSWSTLGNELYGHSDWQHFEEVADVDTGTYTLIFRWTNNSTINNPPAAIDDLSIAQLTCSSVGNLEARHVYAHEADIVWIPRSGETEWWVVVDDGEGYSVSSDSIHLSGYAGETSHTVSVSAICAPGDTSFASTVSFTTTVACMPVANIVATDITGTTATVSWTPGGTETAWKISLNGGDTIDVSDTPSYSFTGLSPMTEYNVVVIADCGTDDSLSLSTSASFLTLCDDGTCNITLEMYDSFGDGWNNGALLVFQNGVEVGSGTITSGNNAATTTVPVCSSMPVSVVFVGGSYPAEMGATILSGSGAELYSFADHTMTSSNNGDTLVTTATPCSGCVLPNGLEVTATTSSSITIAWADMDTLTNFVVSVDGGAWIPVNGITYTATGLNPATIYNFEVRTLCGVGDTSDARSISASTECVSVTVFPMTVGFDNEADFLCWSQNGPGEWRIGTGDNSSSTGAHSGTSNVLITHSSNGNATKLISPVLDLSTQSNVELTFWHVQRRWSGDQDELNVYYRAQATDEWTLLESYTAEIATWTADTIALPNLSTTYQVAFEMVDGYGYGVAIDDITIGTPGATPVPSYSVSATSANGAMGTAAVTPSGLLPEGTTVTAVATPAEGYIFVNWTSEGTAVSTDNPYTFTVTDNIALVANFEAQPEPECEAPTDVTVSDIGLSTATIAWTAAEGQNSWDIHVTATGFEQTFTATTNPYTVSGLASNLEYTVAVRAHCSATNESDWSAPATFTISNCQPVTGVTAANITVNSAQISWMAPDGVDNFELEYGASGFDVGYGTTVRASGTSTTLTGLTPGILYDVYVRSICAEGVYSIWSNATSFETPDDGTEGIDEIGAANIALYPNPASTSVTLTGLERGTTVTIVDMNGRAMGEYTANSNTLTIDLTGYAKGAYFVRITGEQMNANGKLIVK